MIEDILINLLFIINMTFLTIYPAFMANKHKVKFQKDNKYSGWFMNNWLKETKNKNVKTKLNINDKKIQILLPYLEKLKDYTSENNLQTIYNNLRTVKVKRNFGIIMFGASGTFDSTTNSIIYFSNNDLGYELLHCASSYYNSKTKQNEVGFKRGIEKDKIGVGLNEGYTELLSSRLYNKNNEVRSYHNEVSIVKLLEFFFDNPKDMEKYYFNHNLPGFIEQMEKFVSRQEVINLILDMDKITLASKGVNHVPRIETIKLKITLYKWYRNKCKNPEKMQEFIKELFKDKFVAMILRKEKFKLCRENVYVNNKINNEKGKSR